ncbi:hypothetical protein J3R83DRAFT_1452 [Lanmaoa asiatica]|nr:hypothetical protein J3R83DRAFT_1452 [Lanmaoa asiatica]
MYEFEDDVAIATAVRYQMAVKHGEIIEIDPDDDEDSQPTPISCSEIALLCEKLEMACIAQSHANTSLELTRSLHKFCGEMRWEEL